MSSSQAPWWRRWLHQWASFFFKQCPEGNYHWKWDALCFCRYQQHIGDWHGGIMIFKDGTEWINSPEHQHLLHQWLNAEHFICACDELQKHKEQCMSCQNHPLCNQGCEFVRKLEEYGSQYYSQRHRLSNRENQRPWGLEAI